MENQQNVKNVIMHMFLKKMVMEEKNLVYLYNSHFKEGVKY